MKRWIGPILTGLGAVLVVVGFVAGGGGGTAAAGASSTLATIPTTVSEDTSTTLPDTTAVTTTLAATTSSTTSTTVAATTTTTLTAETVEAFVQAFAAALDSGDRGFVGDRLHPVVYGGWGEDLCDAWIDREVMTLSDYTLVRVVSGPADATVTTPTGSVSVADVFAADVTFSFQGQSFESGGSFALLDGVMYWLGQCR